MANADATRTLIDTLRQVAQASSTETLRSEPTRERPPRYIDDREVGHGGMASVRRVRDTTLLCDVAMKLLDPALEQRPAFAERFVEEAQITSQLDHPNIVPVHELGSDPNGRIFFTMKYVRGVSLAEWLQDPERPVGSPTRLADGLDILLKVCDAVSFAHSRGVLHRDLKPANVMIGEFGEVYLMDWGLALLVTETVRTTRDKTRQEAFTSVGTPAFMSPEATRGDPARFDERSDVFGLGAILYQIVTGFTPYGNLTIQAALEAARAGAMRDPEEALAGVGVSKRLLRILKRAMAYEKADRHASAAELKSDIQRFVRGGLYLPRQGFEAGQTIVREGEIGMAAYVIVSGECEAYKTIDGQRKVLRRMGAGEVFGETAVLSDLPRTASVDALDGVTVLVVDRAALDEGIGLDTWVGTLVRALAMRFRELDSELHGLPSRPEI